MPPFMENLQSPEFQGRLKISLSLTIPIEEVPQVFFEHHLELS